MTGRLGSHYYFYTDQQVATTALTDEVGKNIGHIKAGGGQVVDSSLRRRMWNRPRESTA
jgi:hypothetical protein